MIQCFPRWLKNNYTSLRIQLQCSFFLPLGFSLIEQYLFYHSGEEYKALLCILGSSGVQIFAFMILEGSLGFLESVHEREWPVNGGRPYSWVPVKSIEEKKNEQTWSLQIKRNEMQSLLTSIVRSTFLSLKHVRWGGKISQRDFTHDVAFKMQGEN